MENINVDTHTPTRALALRQKRQQLAAKTASALKSPSFGLPVLLLLIFPLSTHRLRSTAVHQRHFANASVCRESMQSDEQPVESGGSAEKRSQKALLSGGDFSANR
ncbi:unnamed protein product [Boreogadus saida]